MLWLKGIVAALAAVGACWLFAMLLYDIYSSEVMLEVLGQVGISHGDTPWYILFFGTNFVWGVILGYVGMELWSRYKGGWR